MTKWVALTLTLLGGCAQQPTSVTAPVPEPTFHLECGTLQGAGFVDVDTGNRALRVLIVCLRPLTQPV